MGDWMGSCVDVKLADRMGHFDHQNDRNAPFPQLI